MVEGNDLAGSEHHIFAGGRVPAFSLRLLLHAEFAEAGDQHVVAGFQRPLDEFQDGFNRFVRFFAGEAVAGGYSFDNVGFGEGAGLGHDLSPLSF